MISLTTIDSDFVYNILIKENFMSETKENTARVNSVPTLDRKYVIVTSGVSDLSRVLTIKGRINTTQETQLWALFNAQKFMLLSIKNEVFLVTIKRLKTDNQELEVTFIIKSKER